MNKIISKNNKISNGTRRSIIFSLLVIFLLLASKTVYASLGFSFGSRQFGGRVAYTEATEITIQKAIGSQCDVLGSTISILPIGSPALTPRSYYIPFSTLSKTKNSLRMGQLIMGKYSPYKTPIVCTSPTGAVTTIQLDTVTLFGNSR